MAAFTLDRFDASQTPIEVDHAVTLKQTGLTWVGQYYSQFGELLLENMLHLSENFAGPVPPNTFDDTQATFGNLLGQLWYDTDDEANLNSRTIKVYDGNTNSGTNGWKRLELVSGSNPPTAFADGEIFYNVSNRTLEISNNSSWNELTVNMAQDSEKLVGIDGQYYMRKDIDQTMNGRLTTINLRPLSQSTYDLGESGRRWREGFFSVLNTEHTKKLIPVDHKSYDLGSPTRNWNNLYVDVSRASSYTDLQPLSHLNYSIGANNNKWNNVYARNAFFDQYNTLIPQNSTRNVGSSSQRWDTGYFKNIDVSSFSSGLIPGNGDDNIGSEDNPWNELYVDLIKSTKVETLIPNTNDVDLGSPTNPFDDIYANVIRGSRYTHLYPLQTLTYNIGSNPLKWNNLYTRYAYIDFYNTLKPRNATQTLGTTNDKWDQGFINIIEVTDFRSNLRPLSDKTYDMGTSNRRWNTLYVDTIKTAKFEGLLPAGVSSNIGTVNSPFNTIYIRELGETNFTGDVLFDIVRNSKSKGISWSGLTDTHEIYVEETANSERTQLVLHSGNDSDDGLVVRNFNDDILEVKRNKVKAYRDIETNKKLTVTDDTGNSGISMEYNDSIGAMEFKFF